MQFRITRERCPDTVEDYQKGCLDRELDRLFHLDWSLNYLLDDMEKKEEEPKQLLSSTFITLQQLLLVWMWMNK